MEMNVYCNEEEMKNRFKQCGLNCSLYSDIVTLTHYESLIMKNIIEWSNADESLNDPDKDKILNMSNGWNEFSTNHAQATWAFSTNLVCV